MLTILCLSQESWLLEGRLAPWVHYAPVRPDFKDVSTTYYTVYNITVTDSEAHTHSLQKRFNEFNELYRAIKNQHPEGASNNPLSMRSHSLSHYPTIFHNS